MPNELIALFLDAIHKNEELYRNVEKRLVEGQQELRDMISEVKDQLKTAAANTTLSLEKKLVIIETKQLSLEKDVELLLIRITELEVRAVKTRVKEAISGERITVLKDWKGVLMGAGVTILVSLITAGLIWLLTK